MALRPFLAVFLACPLALAGAAKRFTLEQAMSAPFPSDLTAAPKGGSVAWVLDQHGARNLWVAEPPDYKGRQLTHYRDDDGQEIDQVTWTPDGRSILYVRGGDFEMRRGDPNPASLPQGVEQDIWIVPLAGGAPRKLAQGNQPAISPKGDRIVFLRKDEVWSVDLDGGAKPAQLIHAKGEADQLRWSPDASKLAFVTTRTDHAFVAVYNFDPPSLTYLDPSVDRDSGPVWSPDAKQVAFLRVAASTRAFSFGPVRTAQPWSIRVADASSGSGRELWRASPGPGSAFHAMVAENQLFWGASDRIVFPWEGTGWMHLYSISIHGDKPTPLNAAGEFEVEDVSLSADRRTVLFSSNQNDTDRRHLWRVSVTGENLAPITRGDTIEWSPVQTSDGKAVAMLHSDARNPARAAIKIDGSEVRDLAPDSVPADFPASSLVVPQPVMISSADGMRIHGQIFMPADASPNEKHPAVIFFHGGSRRQMLLGWHYMDYYNNAYAMNQYLASLGFIVLAVNYRSGIGYGLNFREALNYGATGASEFNDVIGAGLYLRNRPDVDPKRIGVWGGSYGGYLTALALSRASDLFAAGVDFHGVHDWNDVISNFVPAYNPGKDVEAARIAFESSPMASIGTWRSPVLLIHGDDDRNVPFHETVKLVEALRNQGVEFQELIFPDEIHGFLTEKRWIQAYHAAADFLTKHLQ
ncbi:MAG TPA: prolyl oligopeptidase family serine peptidase [Bryobacteraceae bacterium]|nr:prolyl oligopeptidase family serine peptidase [Bryobacteraceae bacterium]